MQASQVKAKAGHTCQPQWVHVNLRLTYCARPVMDTDTSRSETEAHSGMRRCNPGQCVFGFRKR